MCSSARKSSKVVKSSCLPDELLKAYEDTYYHVYHKPPFTLRIGVFSDQALQLQQRLGVNSSAFITAYNPTSQLLSNVENQCRNRRLLEEVTKGAFHAIPGYGHLPTSGWPGEHSILVLGLARIDAAVLSERFGQNAFVYLSEQAVPELVLLR